jgi:hypothetical protein
VHSLFTTFSKQNVDSLHSILHFVLGLFMGLLHYSVAQSSTPKPTSYSCSTVTIHSLHTITLSLYIPYLIFIVNKPCCPSRISWIKVKIASQKTGVMSTPNAGGTKPLATLRSGSVGTTKKIHGTSFTFVLGYHESTTRANCMFKSCHTGVSTVETCMKHGIYRTVDAK